MRTVETAATLVDLRLMGKILRTSEEQQDGLLLITKIGEQFGLYSSEITGNIILSKSQLGKV